MFRCVCNWIRRRDDKSNSAGASASRFVCYWKLARLTVAVILLIAVILTAVVLFRAAEFQSRQIRVEAVPPVGLDEKAAVERLAEALRIRSCSEPGEPDPAEFDKLHRLLEDSFPLTHAVLEREIVQKHSLLYRWTSEGATRQPILIMSHLDVVPVDEDTESRWTHDPWSGEVAEGFIWGRGALDVKSGVLSVLEAVEYLLENEFQPACDVYLAFGHDEEIGGQGNSQIAALLADRGVKLRFVLDEGGAIVEDIIAGLSVPVALVGLAEKGYASVRLTVEQQAGHSSMPPKQTAIGLLSAAIQKLETHQLPARLDEPVDSMLDYLGPEMPVIERIALANRWLTAGPLKSMLSKEPSTNALLRTTTATTVFHAGNHEGSLPGAAEAIVNFRIIQGETPESVLAHVKRTVDDERIVCELTSVGFSPSRVSSHETDEFELLHRTIRQICPDVVVAPGLSVVATDSRHYQALTQNTFRFLPMRLGPEDLNRIHGIDERISIDNYLEMIRFQIRLLENAAR